MPTQSELIGIIKTTFEKKDYEILYPHLADSMTYQVLPSTFVVVPAYCRPVL